MKVRHLLAVSLCVLAVGCTSSKVFQTAGTAASIGRISDVQVAVKPGALDAFTENDFRSNPFAGTIRTALLAELHRQGKTGAQGVTVDFAVTDFRLRSGASVFWICVMGGGDVLAGTVTVRSGNKVVKIFEARAEGNDSMWSGVATGRLTARARADRFAQMIARDIARQL